MGSDSDNGDDGGAGDGPDIETVAASVDSLSETVTEVSEAVDTLKDAVETDKQPMEAAASLADEFEMSGGDVLDIIEAAANHDAQEVLNAIDSLAGDEMEQDAKADDEDDDEDDEEEMESSADGVEKRADDANMAKGADGRQTAATGVEQSGTGGAGLSYRDLAEQQEGN